MSRKTRREWMARWGELLRYNDEVEHGVVHTPEYVEKMALEQQRYNEVFG